MAMIAINLVTPKAVQPSMSFPFNKLASGDIQRHSTKENCSSLQIESLGEIKYWHDFNTALWIY